MVITVATRRIISGPVLPATCSPNSGDVFFLNAGAIGIYACLAPNVWTYVGGGGLPGPAGPAGPVGPAGPGGADGAPGVDGYSPNQLLAGGGVSWVTGYVFDVSMAWYFIGNVQYVSPETNGVTLAVADPLLDRIDAIVVDDTSTVSVVQGIASLTPARPNIDPATQLLLTFILVTRNTLQPPEVSATNIYHENTGAPAEWATSSAGAGFNLASLVNPHLGTKDIEATGVTTGNYVQFDAAAPFDPTIRNNLVFYIQSKAAWASKRTLNMWFANAGTRQGSIVSFREGQFGFSSSNTTAYQQIVIPLTLFAANGLAVNQLRFSVAGSGGAIGFYLDDIELQSGIPGPSAPTAMTWKGPWNATATYVVNDVVSYLNSTWVCLISNTNSAPSLTNGNWASETAGQIGAIDFIIDGGGAEITTGLKMWAPVTFRGTITGWELTANEVCSIAVDVFSAAYAAAPPAVGSIWGAVPALVGAQRNTASGLGIAFTAGTYFRANVNSVAGCTAAVLHVALTKD